MNIGNALGFPSAAPFARAARDVQAPAAGETTDATRGDIQHSAEFAAFLTRLIGNNPSLKTDLLKQLPADGAGLLDKLLNSAASGDAESAETAMTAATATQVEAARYSLMTDTARVASRSAQTASPTASAAAASPAPAAARNAGADARVESAVVTRAQRNAATRAQAQSVLASMQSGIGGDEADSTTSTRTFGSADNRISPAVLARIASGKAASVEELMAIGDNAGALARAKLDNVLAKAGTDEGYALAASNAAANAASIALAAALATSAADISTPVSDTRALDPELQNRLQRVIDRMKNEYGHDVTVVETARSQERQDHLYAQGRTAPGEVVTWVTDSTHTHGAAADVIVDGSWNNAKGFARLQQIAGEEGLRTIPKDPGHLELPRDAWTTDAAVRVTSAASSQSTANSNGVAQVASVARVAAVASTAATQSTAGNITNSANSGLPQLAQQAAGANATSSGAHSADTRSDKGNTRDADKQARRETGSATEKDVSKSGASLAHDRVNDKSLNDVQAPATPRFIGPSQETAPAASSSAAAAAERVQDINALREQQGGKAVSQMTLQVEGPNGTTQEITLDVRGNAVSTHISADSSSADSLRSNVGELKTGLESRGLESDSVRISTQGARTNDGGDATRSTSAMERDVVRMNSTGSAAGSSAEQSAQQQQQRDRSSSARDLEDRQAARDEQRAQHRDAQGRGSGNQDRQRPQYQEKQ